MSPVLAYLNAAEDVPANAICICNPSMNTIIKWLHFSEHVLDGEASVFPCNENQLPCITLLPSRYGTIAPVQVLSKNDTQTTFGPVCFKNTPLDANTDEHA